MENREEKIKELQDKFSLTKEDAIKVVDQIDRMVLGEPTQEKEDEWKEFDEKFKEEGFTNADAAYCEDAASRAEGCWKLKHIKSFISTHYVSKKVLKERMIEKAIEKKLSPGGYIAKIVHLDDILDLIK